MIAAVGYGRNNIAVTCVPRKLGNFVIDVRESPAGTLNKQDQRIAAIRIRVVFPRINHAQCQILAARMGINDIRRNFRQTVKGGISLDGNVHDNTRVDYLKRHLSKMEKILADGIDLRGYYVWSLMDNFEWLKGYSTRFGLVYVDYENELKRIKKDSFYFYKEYIENFNK